jgi:hypothetical protein
LLQDALEDHFADLDLNVWPAPKSGGNFRRCHTYMIMWKDIFRNSLQRGPD